MTRNQLIGTVMLIVALAGAVAIYRWVADRAATPDPTWQVAIERYTPQQVDSITTADSVKRAAAITDTAAPPKRAKTPKAKKAATSPPPPARDAFNDVMRQDNR